MTRAIVSPKTLDALIRAKLATLTDCPHVEALPVALTESRDGRGCNWVIPGWLGDAGVVNGCLEKLQHYLDFLREQFDIAPERVGGE